MLDTVISLLGIDLEIYNVDHNLIFVCLFTVLIFSMGYVFNFFQTLIERSTAKKR